MLQVSVARSNWDNEDTNEIMTLQTWSCQNFKLPFRSLFNIFIWHSVKFETDAIYWKH